MTKNKKWLDVIEEVKHLLENKQQSQMYIAGLALKVCTVNHGGIRSPNSLLKFAEEIGVNTKLLYHWVEVRKNVYDKLPVELQHRASYNICHIVSRKVGRRTPADEVVSRVITILENKKDTYKVMRYCSDLRALAFNFDTTDVVNECGDKLLEEILFYAGLVTRQIKKAKPNIVPKDNLLTARHKIENMQMNVKAGIRGRFRNNEGKSVILREKEEKIYNFMVTKKKKLWSPTDIGMQVGGHTRNSASAWACRGLDKLASVGLVISTQRGRYKVDRQRAN